MTEQDDDDIDDDDETLLCCHRSATRRHIIVVDAVAGHVVPVVIFPRDTDDEPSSRIVALRHSRQRRQSTSNAETKSIRQTYC